MVQNLGTKEQNTERCVLQLEIEELRQRMAAQEQKTAKMQEDAANMNKVVSITKKSAADLDRVTTCTAKKFSN
ncbi:hypothetical protein ColTof4_06238 [Colletotrichum tofieldiae]|nr:hypothetical protein ColTof3_01425 [Colletotrichum tofieldiae]GKT73815.1 hypothetical protein ColTof4_06238 [Colletotrichum tofieldiae]GKT95782.1 hypothetical protein Ct61P_13632 [Colletotrichum tofieldiae]